MSSPIRVLIVDDHLIVRQGLRLLFETEDGIELIGEAENGKQGLSLAKKLAPNVILMDLQMPEMDGLTAIKTILATQPQIAIIILTTYNEDASMVEGLQAGAKGFLLKDTNRADLVHSIEAAARGETLLKPEIMDKVLAYQQSGGAKSAQSSILSARETEVLLQVAEGATNKQIAYEIEVSERTVKAHLTSIYNKFGVDSRAAAIAHAAKAGLL